MATLRGLFISDRQSMVAAVNSPKTLLGPEEAGPFEILAAGAPRPVVLACDHASNRVPLALGNLGLAPTHLEQHIAWDIGAGAVTRLLSERLRATAILGGYSRLVVDLNRALGDATAYPAISDGVLVPLNLGLDDAARAMRARALYKPYHEALRRIIQAQLHAESAPVLVCIHSFTPKLYGVRRPWQIGLLWHKDPRLAVPLMAALRQSGEVAVGDNQPYSGHHPADFTIDHHAEPLGLAHVGVEIRQDLINDVNGQQHWAGILADALESVLASASLYRSIKV